MKKLLALTLITLGLAHASRAANLVWSPTDSNWDTTTANWTNIDTSLPATFADGDNVLFDDANNFTANANAAVYGTTGGKGFFTDSSGVIRYADGADADAASEPIGE